MARTYHLVPIDYVNRKRFWRWVKRTDECWLWTRKGGTGTNGAYGLFDIQVPTPWGQATLRQSTHRIAYAISIGQIPEGKEIMHKCNTPRCVRPDHLEPGTPLQNSAYKVKHNRQARGEHVGGGGRAWAPGQRLTADKVIEIRSLFAARSARMTELAKKFGVGWNSIASLVHGRSWKHVGGPLAPVSSRSGSDHPNAKFTEADVVEIRRLRDTSGASTVQLAKRYGVSKQAIIAILKRKTWRHIP